MNARTVPIRPQLLLLIYVSCGRIEQEIALRDTVPIDSEMYRFLCNFVLPEYSIAR
jgi:hypothetical protein